MELKQFVEQTLVQILNGVKDAQKETEGGDGGEVNPVLRDNYNLLKTHNSTTDNPVIVDYLEFDVAVTVQEKEDAKVGAAAVIAVMGLGAQGKVESSNTSVSRIKFKVPISLPQSKKSKIHGSGKVLPNSTHF